MILKLGRPLSQEAMRDAVTVGVKHPEKIRILAVEKIPLPENPMLKWLSRVTGLFCFAPVGMCLRYGIFINQHSFPDRLLIAHECVHTAQYERLGGFRPFLRQYLEECLAVGYDESPLELEAMMTSQRIQTDD